MELGTVRSALERQAQLADRLGLIFAGPGAAPEDVRAGGPARAGRLAGAPVRGQCLVPFGQGGPKAERRLRFQPRILPSCARRVEQRRRERMRPREPGPREGEARIEPARLRVQRQHLPNAVGRHALFPRVLRQLGGARPQVPIVRARVGRRREIQHPSLGSARANSQCGYDCVADVALDAGHLAHRTLESSTPQLRPAADVEQLRLDAYAVIDATKGAAKDHRRLLLGGDLADRLRTAAVGRHGLIARRDDSAELREVSSDRVGQPDGEVAARRRVSDRHERKHREPDRIARDAASAPRRRGGGGDDEQRRCRERTGPRTYAPLQPAPLRAERTSHATSVAGAELVQRGEQFRR